jgi:Exostosin family
MQAGPNRDRFTTEYAEAILDSQFILCPAGHGPSTYRLFEAMRVPVILSDEWVPPPGPRWNEFSLQIPERLVDEVPSILSVFSDRHEAMGRQARVAWEEWFAKPVCFHRLIDLCIDIQATPLRPWSAQRAWGIFFRPPHLRNVLRPYYHHTIRRLHSAARHLKLNNTTGR